MITKECIWCGELIMDRSKRQNKKFCCPTHRTLWYYHNNSKVKARMKLSSLKQSERRKHNPEARLKQKLYFDKYRKINKLKINKLMREVMRKRLGVKPENYRTKMNKEVKNE